MKRDPISERLTGGVKATAGLSWAIAREAGASILTYELYPLGIIGPLPRVPSLKRSDGRKRVPILFIHGILHNRATFAWIVQNLALKGWREFREMNLMTTFHSIPRMAEQVGEAVDSLRRRCNVPQVDVIAHSLGGIIARYYVQLQGGDGPVRNLITLGTPHGGTELSRLSILPNVRDLNPESPIIRRLNAGPPPRHTQGLAISGALDIVVRPRSHAWWKGVRNVELKRVGHAGLLFSGRVAKLIESRLN
ncbi:MAG: alpha/beta fold hydrolase [Deltaproteobacteria bacterium]|nr:alpha/beta fold hydrolase [Deltaproteobacteria bacterium]